MDFSKVIQPAFAIAIIGIAYFLMFFKVPTENAEYFKTVLTALISFISGVAVATAASQTKGATDVQKTIPPPDPLDPAGL